MKHFNLGFFHSEAATKQQQQQKDRELWVMFSLVATVLIRSSRNSKIRDENSLTLDLHVFPSLPFHNCSEHNPGKDILRNNRGSIGRRKSRKQSMLGWLTHGHTRLKMSVGNLHHRPPPRTHWPRWKTPPHGRWWGRGGLYLQWECFVTRAQQSLSSLALIRYINFTCQIHLLWARHNNLFLSSQKI